jgi:hypothetical protein
MAARAILTKWFKQHDADEAHDAEPDTLEATLEGARELVDEVAVSFTSDDAERFYAVLVQTPEGWTPEDALAIPEACAGGFGKLRFDDAETRTGAFQRCARENGKGKYIGRGWYVVVELGDDIALPGAGYDTVIQGAVGVATLTEHYPLRIVVPTAEEKTMALAEVNGKKAKQRGRNVPLNESPERLGNRYPVEKANGHAAGHCDPKQPTKRQTLTQILRANGFDKFVGGELDERTQTFDLEFDVAGPRYVPAFDDRIDLEHVLLALATDLEETARKFRKAAAEGLARPGDEEKGDKDDDDQLYRVVADGDVILDSLPRDVAEKIAASTNEARGREVAAVEPVTESAAMVKGGVA